MAFVFAACGADSFIGTLTPPSSAPVALRNMEYSADKIDSLRSAVEVIPDRLYYIALKVAPSNVTKNGIRNGRQMHWFQIDTELLYWNFFRDFGPLNLGQLYRFCTKLNNLLDTKPNQTIVFYSSSDQAKRANATYLICAWQLLYMNRTPEEAQRGFQLTKEQIDGPNLNASAPPENINSFTVQALNPFHDASPCNCTYDLTVLDCLRGLVKARMYGFLDFSTFRVEEYEHYEQVENGDLNWIVKDRIIAFAGPHYRRNVSPEGYCTLTPAHYIPYFKEHKVDLVVRLNKKCYDEQDFVNAGIRHFEQYYLDGSCPPIKTLDSILEAFESVPSDKAFAVHCKAGLGRTGTCIGAFLMKHYKFSAAEAIGWMRICRPGMVIGPQQHFLQDLEQRMWHEGSVMNLRPTQDVMLLRITESNRSKEQEKSPKSVAAIPFVESAASDEAVIGIDESQADGLLARRNQARIT